MEVKCWGGERKVGKPEGGKVEKRKAETRKRGEKEAGRHITEMLENNPNLLDIFGIEIVFLFTTSHNYQIMYSVNSVQ